MHSHILSVVFWTAFEALDNATVTFLTSEEGLADLRDILLYHVVPGILLSEAAEDGAVETVNGAELMVVLPGSNMTLLNETGATAVSRTIGGSIMINDATVTSADILVNNGVIHVIDSILLPPAPPLDTEDEEVTDKGDKNDSEVEELEDNNEEEEMGEEEEEEEVTEEDPEEENEEEEEMPEEEPVEENEEEEEPEEEEEEEEDNEEEEDVDMDAENGM